jgi:hypothetical protein
MSRGLQLRLCLGSGIAIRQWSHPHSVSRGSSRAARQHVNPKALCPQLAHQLIGVGSAGKTAQLHCPAMSRSGGSRRCCLRCGGRRPCFKRRGRRRGGRSLGPWRRHMGILIGIGPARTRAWIRDSGCTGGSCGTRDSACTRAGSGVSRSPIRSLRQGTGRGGRFDHGLRCLAGRQIHGDIAHGLRRAHGQSGRHRAGRGTRQELRHDQHDEHHEDGCADQALFDATIHEACSGLRRKWLGAPQYIREASPVAASRAPRANPRQAPPHGTTQTRRSGPRGSRQPAPPHTPRRCCPPR